MNLNYKMTFAGLALGCLVATNAVAADNAQKIEPTSNLGAVLFRIENIAPITNKDGLTDQCSFMVTVYNRMNKGLKSADIDMEWVDNISNKYKVTGNKIKVVSDSKAEEHINKTITIDNIAPHSQKSFAQKVDTDKCYLLLDNLKYNVKTCFIEGGVVQYKDSQATNIDDCSNNFNYINSKNPEYFSEFKDVPASVLTKQIEDEKERELSKVNATVDAIISSLEKTSKELERIK